MHVAHHVDVTDTINKEGDNVLELRFTNAPEWGRKELKRIGYKGNGTDVHFGQYALPSILKATFLSYLAHTLAPFPY